MKSEFSFIVVHLITELSGVSSPFQDSLILSHPQRGGSLIGNTSVVPGIPIHTTFPKLNILGITITKSTRRLKFLGT